jgi:hypothetical protein
MSMPSVVIALMLLCVQTVDVASADQPSGKDVGGLSGGCSRVTGWDDGAGR